MPLGKLVKYFAPHFSNVNNVNNYCYYIGYLQALNELNGCQSSGRMSHARTVHTKQILMTFYPMYNKIALNSLKMHT